MEATPIKLFKSFSEELDPDRLQHKFLLALLNLYNVTRGSIWIKKQDRYLCIEAVGLQSESIKGASINKKHPSIVGWVIENGKMTIADPVKDERHYREFEEKLDVKSRLILCFPLFLKDKKVYGAVQIIDTTTGKNRINLNSKNLSHIQELIDVGSIALSNALIYNQQRHETETLKETLKIIQSEGIIVGQDPLFQNAMKLVKSYAATDLPVLITGESGTGKDLISNRIHHLSTRKDKPLLVQNCSVIPQSLLESELFGYKKGAFSGAVKDKIGLFEAAEGGTVFLDEIGDMPMNLQASLLRVIQNGEIKPLGSTETKQVNVRIVSATNKDIQHMVANNTFREDLYYRLSVLPLHLPSLRNRPEDIPLLCNHFIKNEAIKLNLPPKKISDHAMRILTSYPWAGNIRELENLIKYLLVISIKEEIGPEDLPPYLTNAKPAAQPSQALQKNSVSAIFDEGNTRHEYRELQFNGNSWEEVERTYALYLLNKNNWNITRSAKEAKLNRSTFVSRIKRLGIK